MALVREPKKTLPCDAEFAVETETSFSVLDGADSVITYDEYLHHPWERIQFLAGALGAEPGNDGSWTWTNVTAGVSSSSSPSPVTFHGHDEEGCAAWMDTTEQLSFGAMAPGHATGSASPSILSINMDDMLPTKRPRTHHGAPEEAATAARKRAKEPTAVPPKETQRTSAKNRRERVNERMKVLQELVPNGRKVDTVTMLDKAITYVKFMQLQLKVLETDAFWPTQAGKAPEMSQVKETLDAILFSSTSSQCDH